MFLAWMIAGLLGLALAGIGWWLPGRRHLAMERVAVRLGVGLAAGVIVLYAGTAAVGLLPAAVFAIVIGLVGWARMGRLRWRPMSWEMGLLILIGAALASTGVMAATLPRGFDPSFHCLIGRIVLLTDGIPHSWEPFEPVQLNYPLGPHLLIATIARLGGCELHAAFLACMWWFCALQVPMTWLVARRLLGNSRAALGAALVFALTPDWGAPVNFTQWGGLPMLIDQVFFLAFVLLLLRRPKFRDWLAGGTLLAAVVMTHHLAAMLIAAILGLYLISGAREWRFLLGSVAVQLLLASGFLFSFVAKVRALDSTHALKFLEEPILGPMAYIEQAGAIFVGLVIAGLLWGVIRRVRYVHGRFLLCWVLALAGGYLVFGQLYPRYMLATTGEAAMAFTPSRWATMLTSPLAILAAWPFVQRWSWWIAFPLLLCGGYNQLQWPNDRYAPENLTMYRQLARILPADAFVLNTITHDPLEIAWQAVLSGHEVRTSPLPASEPRDAPEIQAKQAVMRTGTPEQLFSWCEARGKPCFILAPSTRTPPAGALEPIWQNGRFVVYRLHMRSP